MTTDKSIEEIAQEYIPHLKILEEAGSFAVFLLDRFGRYYYVTEYVTEDIQASDKLNIEKLVYPDDLEVVRRIDKKVWEFLDTLPEEEKLTYKYIYEMRVLDRGKYVRMIYQMRILAFKDDNFLGMGIIDLAPEQSANTSVRFQIKNCLTDEIVPFAIESATNTLLTPREREILALAKEGMFSKEISEKLNISVHTVNRHRQNILEKLQVGNIIEAIRS
ncbi:transcriptional regulator, LuxR family [Capnocytophaga ochracea DSM 7271]|uniref:Transcriptional regulator, LuxR family n=1 Tax=Capnocytophaga ochracea (strain ATCC 27872 / DSM 7271 / CCUG 9716 / JCM 12966 / NCTC 12371 / SS31 / VPI 2845) TaxID=521097 RepID=C7M4D4_CAPOD|nr:LuxR C-terminal-related transcriptional regulator [Capnocytophaga ochracea]ACU92689.1 transcriptional regulator, LuxR family [Capnocytophaga ochracea DSM 7271]UAK51411.1 LuxR C-terminal-related transcriptional regulator [Capnocytophaga ochracea]